MLYPLVDLGGEPRDAGDRVGGKAQRHALGADQRRILLGQAGLCLGQDADEIRLAERCEFDADRQAALEFGKRSEEHTSELQSLMRSPYAVVCLQKNNTKTTL